MSVVSGAEVCEGRSCEEVASAICVELSCHVISYNFLSLAHLEFEIKVYGWPFTEVIGEGYGERDGFFVATHYTCLHNCRCKLQSRRNIHI